MTNDEIRIAIAKTCGWKHFSPPPAQTTYETLEGIVRIFAVPPDSKTGVSIEAPDYPNDLNAILAVVREKIEGDDSLESKFLRRLSLILDRRADDETRCICDMDLALITCSASEYCEAALVALGKWVEDEQ